NSLKDEETTNRSQFDKYFSRYLPPGVIPGLQEKVPVAQMSQSFSSSLLETNLPSIDNPHEIQNIDLESIQSLCGGNTLGQGILKMYETTLDDNQIFRQMEEFSMNEDDSSFHITSYNDKSSAMLYSSSSMR